MAETTPTWEKRVRDLERSYREILDSYEKVERLSLAQHRALAEDGSIARVNELLTKKKDLMREIHAEEERVTGSREWWKKARRSLPSQSCRELLSLLDAISRKIERILSLEADCRVRLERATAWGPNATRRSDRAASGAARNAYGIAAGPEGAR